MTRRAQPGLGDLLALHGQQVTVEQVDLIEDVDGTPAWIDVEREAATVVIVPSLLGPLWTPPPESDAACVAMQRDLPEDAPARHGARTTDPAPSGSSAIE